MTLASFLTGPGCLKQRKCSEGKLVHRLPRTSGTAPAVLLEGLPPTATLDSLSSISAGHWPVLWELGYVHIPSPQPRLPYSVGSDQAVRPLLAGLHPVDVCQGHWDVLELPGELACGRWLSPQLPCLASAWEAFVVFLPVSPGGPVVALLPVCRKQGVSGPPSSLPCSSAWGSYSTRGSQTREAREACLIPPAPSLAS